MLTFVLSLQFEAHFKKKNFFFHCIILQQGEPTLTFPKKYNFKPTN